MLLMQLSIKGLQILLFLALQCCFFKCNLCEVIYFYLCRCLSWSEVLEKKTETSKKFCEILILSESKTLWINEFIISGQFISLSSSSLVSFQTNIHTCLVSYTFLIKIITDFLDIWNIFRPTKCLQDNLDSLDTSTLQQRRGPSVSKKKTLIGCSLMEMQPW